jgi:hypothetical protein
MRRRAVAALLPVTILFVVTATLRPGTAEGATAAPAGTQASAFPVSTDRSGWLPWKPPISDYAGSVLDMSRFLDAPAG